MDWITGLLGSIFAFVPIIFVMWIVYIIVSTYALAKSNSDKLDKIMKMLKKENENQE